MNRRIVVGTIFIVASVTSQAATFAECQAWQNQIQHLQDLNHKGGKAKQQALRRQKISRYEAAYYQCRNRQTIEITTGRSKIRAKPYRQKLRGKMTPNLKLRTLIDTCNYWISQHNLHPSGDNRNFRDTACRAADQGTFYSTSSQAPMAPRVKTLGECIKPNNTIDDDVNQCLQGKKEATWSKANTLNAR